MRFTHSTALAFSLSLIAHQAIAALPTRDPDLNRPVNLRGHVQSIDASGPWVDVHFVDDSTGKRYVFWLGTPNTLKRGGISGFAEQAPILVDGYVDKRGPCADECRIAMRSFSLPDGRKVFLGALPDPGR
jgi:hypothetical protein